MRLPVCCCCSPLPAPARVTAPAAASGALAAFTPGPDVPFPSGLSRHRRGPDRFKSFSQLISCENDLKTEILLDHAAPRARAPRARPRTALTVTTRHLNQRPSPLASAAGLCALSEFIIAWIVGKSAKARALRRNCVQARGEMVTAMSVLGAIRCAEFLPGRTTSTAPVIPRLPRPGGGAAVLSGVCLS